MTDMAGSWDYSHRMSHMSHQYMTEQPPYATIAGRFRYLGWWVWDQVTWINRKHKICECGPTVDF